MQLRYFQKGFNYAQDGPGNRLVYHLQGCNLRCPWCSNPEGLEVTASAEAVTIEELVQEAVRSKPMFFEGGGVTFTGGEATLQFDALKQALAELKKAGISTAIETNGTSKQLPELLELIDYWMMDIKHPDSEWHLKFTGQPNEQILKNIRLVAKSGKPLLVRMPLIGGVNTDNDACNKTISFFESIAAPNVSFEFLKYHEYGKDKWKKCGLEYTMKDAFVSEAFRQEMEEQLRKRGLSVVRT